MPPLLVLNSTNPNWVPAHYGIMDLWNKSFYLIQDISCSSRKARSFNGGKNSSMALTLVFYNSIPPNAQLLFHIPSCPGQLPLVVALPLV